MRLSTAGYYADFIIYPALLAGLAGHGLVAPTSIDRVTFAAAGATGLVGWTLIEYVLHRFLLHHAPVLAEMHETHHDNPRDLIGTPSWVSLPIAAAVLFSLSMSLGFAAGGGLTVGLMAGYLWYITVHHFAHHGPLHGSRYLYWARRRHAVHHSRETGNFGVTTDLWDRVCGTALAGGKAPLAQGADQPAQTLG